MSESVLLGKGRVCNLYVNGEPVEEITCMLDGILGDKHYGNTRPLDGHDGSIRRTSGLAKGHIVKNERQWTGVSYEEMQAIGNGLEKEITGDIFCANFVFSGIPGFSQLPPGAYIAFPLRDIEGFQTRAQLRINEENGPCSTIGDRLAIKYPDEIGLSRALVREAQRNRGLMGPIFSNGIIKPNDVVEIWSTVQR